MHKQNLLTLTLIISGLALNPAVAEVRAEAPTQTQNHNSSSVVSSISFVLYNRGLDEDVAEELAANYIDAEDEQFLAQLLQMLEVHNIATREKVLDYMSNAALHRQQMQLKSYDSLVAMVSSIKQKSLDTQTLKQLGVLAKVDKRLFA